MNATAVPAPARTRPERMRAVLLYDGHCRLCVAGAGRVVVLARPGAVERRDFQAPGVLDAFPDVTREACLESIHLVTPEGRVFRGLEAMARTLATRGIWGAWAYLYYVPGLRFLGDRLYAWVARNRYRFLGRTDACTDEACAVHR